MAKNKTAETQTSVTDFVNLLDDEKKRDDSFRIIDIMGPVTGFEPKMWGASIIGFGTSHYKYESGHEGDMPLAGFSPRKNAIVLYLSIDADRKEALLSKLGKYKAGKGCIYLKKLDDINIDVLKEMITASVDQVNSKKPLS